MHDKFSLHKEDFFMVEYYFNVLQISSEEAIGKNYKNLSGLMKKQYMGLTLKFHPDKNHDKDRTIQNECYDKFIEVDKVYKILQEYIKPLENGLPCNGMHVKSNLLTSQEFKYFEKVFIEYNLSEKEIVGKGSNELLPIFKRNNKLKEDIECYENYSATLLNILYSNTDLQGKILRVCSTVRSDKLKYFTMKTLLDKTGQKPLIDADKKNLFGILFVYKLQNNYAINILMHLFSITFSNLVIFVCVPCSSSQLGNQYITKILSNMFSELLYAPWILGQLRNDYSINIFLDLFSPLLSNLVIFCYASRTLVCISIFSQMFLCAIGWVLFYSILKENLKSVKKSRSSIDKLRKVLNFYCKVLSFYYLAVIVSAASLLAYSSIISGLTTELIIGIVIFGSLLSKMIWNNLIAIGIDIYISRKADDLHISTSILDLLNDLDDSTKNDLINELNLLIEINYNRKDFTEEEWLEILKLFCSLDANLLHDEPLKTYDPRRLLMPLVMPIVQWKFKDFETMLAQRTIDTDMSNVNITCNQLAIMPSLQ